MQNSKILKPLASKPLTIETQSSEELFFFELISNSLKLVTTWLGIPIFLINEWIVSALPALFVTTRILCPNFSARATLNLSKSLLIPPFIPRLGN